MNREKSDDILFERKGGAGLITLNRPKALNALTREMCLALHDQLDLWRDDAAVEAVIIRGAGDRAFCAGGDVVALYNAGKAGRPDWENFFADEYRMNAAIGAFPKPYVALLDGIFMGGGVGVSVHGPYRVATERTLFAMPETGIGLIPDVGGGHFMPRLPGEVGMYYALTGQRAGAADCMAAGITTHGVPSETIETLVEEISQSPSQIDSILKDHSTAFDEGGLDEVRPAIDRHFAADSVEEIVESLAAEKSDWAEETRGTLLKMSPTSLKLTFAEMRRGRELDLKGALRMEYRLVSAIKSGHDFYEGVRAQLIDKDRNPQWNPATLAEVDAATVERYFEPPPWGDLDFAR